MDHGSGIDDDEIDDDSLYLIVSLEGVRPEILGDPKASYLHTVPERIAYRDALGSRAIPFLPVTLEHAGFETTDEGVLNLKPGDHVGRLFDIMTRADGTMLGSVEIFHELPHVADIIAKDIKAGIRWGGSLGKDLEFHPTRFDIEGKRMNHLGLTRNPAHGDDKHGATWVTHASRSKDGHYLQLNTLLEDEVNKGRPVEMHPDTRQRHFAMVQRAHARREKQVAQKTELQKLRATSSDLTLPNPVAPPATAASAPPTTATAAIPPSAFISSSSSSPPMAAVPTTDAMPGVTPTNTTPAPPAVTASVPATTAAAAIAAATAPPSGPQRFERFYDIMSDLRKDMFPNGPLSKDSGPIITPKTLRDAALARKAFLEAAEPLRHGEVPEDADDNYRIVKNFLKNINEAMETAGVYDKNNAELAAIQREAVSNPLDNLPVAMSVVSNYNNTLKNADVFSEKFTAARSAAMETENKFKEAEAKLAEANKLLKEREDAIAALNAEKRARTAESERAVQTPVATPNGTQLTHPGATPAGLQSVPGNATSRIFGNEQLQAAQRENHNSRLILSVGSSREPTVIVDAGGSGRRFVDLGEQFAPLTTNWAPKNMDREFLAKSFMEGSMGIPRFSDIKIPHKKWDI